MREEPKKMTIHDTLQAEKKVRSIANSVLWSSKFDCSFAPYSDMSPALLDTATSSGVVTTYFPSEPNSISALSSVGDLTNEHSIAFMNKGNLFGDTVCVVYSVEDFQNCII